MKEFENEIPKYKKKSTNKSIKKSDHKHNYLPCYINYDFMNPITREIERKYLLSTYCTICGYIGDISFFEFNNEIIKKYNLTYKDTNNLPTFIVNDIFRDKFVILNQNRK